jgi:putative transcriptional regulator
MTQAQLAERIGVTRQTIIAIEQGRYSPSLEMAFQIAGVFRVPLDEVFQYPDGEGEPGQDQALLWYAVPSSTCRHRTWVSPRTSGRRPPARWLRLDIRRWLS